MTESYDKLVGFCLRVLYIERNYRRQLLLYSKMSDSKKLDDKTAKQIDHVVNGLKKIYKKTILPVEKSFRFDIFHEQGMKIC